MNTNARATLAVAFLLFFASPADAAQLVLGTTNAQLCYEAATNGPEPNALDSCTTAIRKSELTRTNLAATYSNRGILWVALGELDQALADQNKALSLRPSARAYVNRANIHYRRENFREALSDYSQAIEMSDGNLSTVYYNRALTHRALGDLDNAKSDLAKAMRIAPQNTTYREIMTTFK